MSRYIPMPAYTDRMPVDISFVFEDEKPAGKHGFLKIDGEDFRFEDGTLGRFWGVNINGAACFPSKEYAKNFATRIAQSGCNLVRFHQLDAPFSTPNIFSFTKGRRETTSRQLNPKAMDALDHLIYCLKEEGIYCYLDMLTYRQFREGDGVEDAHLLGVAAKPWCYTNARLIELQKEFMTQIWTHYNPYTGLQYKDDPVFILTEVVNECDLFRNREPKGLCSFYEREFRADFSKWIEKKGLTYDWANYDFANTDDALLTYKIEVSKKYYKEMKAHMREIGVKIPIAATNWSAALNAMYRAQEDEEFTDSHRYPNKQFWNNEEHVSPSFTLSGERENIGITPTVKAPGKPFFISEWDVPWPNAYRGESPIYYAALAAFQNWSGAAIHTYSYTTNLNDTKILGKEFWGPIGGIAYREGMYTIWNDPAKFGLFYHSALILRRCDVSPGIKKVAVNFEKLTDASGKAVSEVVDIHRVACVYDKKLPEGFEELIDSTDTYPTETDGLIVSDNGQLWRDIKKSIGAVDTPRTKVVYGMLGRMRGGLSLTKEMTSGVGLDGLEVRCKTDYAVIAMSSLTDAPLEESDNILLSTIGRACNTDMYTDGDKVLNEGRPPILAEVIDAEIKMKTVHGERMVVWGITPEGFQASKIPTSYKDGVLSFRVGGVGDPACYYLITKE